MANTAVFRAGGLASGIDSNSIIDELVSLESAPITALRTRQAAFNTQVSIIGGIAGQLAALKTATDALGQNGALGVTSSSSNASFTATPSSSSLAGRYSVQVNTLATAAQARSQPFSANDAPVQGGTLAIGVQGTTTNVAITDGMSLSDVATAIQASGAGVSAVVLNDGTNSYLSISALDTGYPITGVPSDAMSLTMTTTGTTGSALTFPTQTAAINASVSVNGLTFTRQSNTPDDVIPGTTIQLKSEGGPAENLVLQNDVASTTSNLQKFVDAYNAVINTVQGQLDVQSSTDRASTLAGDSSIRSLQAGLQGLISSQVNGLSGFRTLADIGIKTAQDGTLSIDSTVLGRALARDPKAINTLFSDQTSGIGTITSQFVDMQTNSVDGILTIRQNGLKDTVTQMDDTALSMQNRVDAYKDQLIAQFTAMETIVSNMKSLGNFLTQQSSASGGK